MTQSGIPSHNKCHENAKIPQKWHKVPWLGFDLMSVFNVRPQPGHPPRPSSLGSKNALYCFPPYCAMFTLLTLITLLTWLSPTPVTLGLGDKFRDRVMKTNLEWSNMPKNNFEWRLKTFANAYAKLALTLTLAIPMDRKCSHLSTRVTSANVRVTLHPLFVWKSLYTRRIS